MSKENVLKLSVKCGNEKKDFDLPYELTESPLTEVYAFTVEGDLWKICSDVAYLANKGKFSVLGFRKGHAPRSVIENNYGKDVFVADTEEVVVNEVYNALMDTKTIKAERLAMRPALDVSELSNGKVAFSLTVAYLPEVTDLKYTGLDIEKVNADVDGAVEREIAAARDRAGYWNSVERAVKEGDQINLDYSGSVDGVKFDGGKRAELLDRRDFNRFDYFIGMDRENLRAMQRILRTDEKIHLLLDFTEEGGYVSDPWYTRDFELAYSDIKRGCEALYNKLTQEG